MNTIQIGGAKRPYHYTVGVLKQIIRSTGADNPETVPFSRLNISGDTLSLDSLTNIIHAALNAGAKRTGGAMVSIDQVGDWIDDMTLDEMMGTFNTMTGVEDMADEKTDESPN